MQPKPAVPATIPILVCLVLLFQVTVSNSRATEGAQHRYEKDLQLIEMSRNGMKSIIAFIDVQPEIFPAVKTSNTDRLLDRQQRMVVWQTWKSFLDYVLFYDSMGRMYTDTYLSTEGNEQKLDSFAASFASFLTQYRFTLDYIDRMEKNPSMHIMLNEPVPELGLKEETYTLLKFRFLNVIRGAEFARLNILYNHYKENNKSFKSPLQATIEEDIDAIWTTSQQKGPLLTVKNAAKIISDLGLTTLFPVQKGASELMGNIKIRRLNRSLIIAEQIKQLSAKLQPGDILLQRREWYASNVGIPGFWTHAALYIGTPAERTDFFQRQELAHWLTKQGSEDGTLDSLLRVRYPDYYQLSILPREENHAPSILEAIGEGVLFTTLEHSAAADSIVVLRPNLSQKAIARAILNAFHYSGRPYDFNFDFRTDSELVCSELIFKAYQQSGDYEGLSLPLSEILGRPIISPNEIAELFDKEYGLEGQQLTFVAFLDGNEKELKAVESNVEQFRQSWKRPKWSVWIQRPADNMSSTLSP